MICISHLILNFVFQLNGYHTCINFTIERWYPVANMSRYLPVRVYDYYAPGEDASISENCGSLPQ